MPLSYAHSTGDGVNRNFDVPCEYLSKAHISVKVDGVAVPFSWIDTYRLLTATAPPMASVVEVRRTTPRTERLVTFTDGSTLVQSDLNTSTLQSFFLSQEAFDQGAASMAVTEDGQFSALTRRLSNLGDPVFPQDAVTRNWAETAMSSQLQQAKAKAAEAATSASQSLTSKNASEAAATSAATSRDTAATKATEAGTSATAAATKAAEAGTKAAQAAQSAADALTHKTSAAASASAAAASAAAAATFDPATYYTKTQMDAQLGTNGRRNLTISSEPPSGGADGDIWYQV